MPEQEREVELPMAVRRIVAKIGACVFDIMVAAEDHTGVKVTKEADVCVICGERRAACIIEKDGKQWRQLRTCAPCAIRNLEGIGGS
jgi:hypothetical protein